MAFTTAQLTLIKAEIDADPMLSGQPNTPDGAFAIAEMLNLEDAPAYVVWRTNIPTHDVKDAIVWTEYINLGVGERGGFELMISNDIVDASSINIRQGIQDIFSGPNQADTRTNMVAISKRNARRIERILVTTGTGTSGDPGTMGYEGTISYRDVLEARAL